MHAVSSRLFRPDRGRWSLAAVGLALLATSLVLLAFAATLVGAAGASTPAEMDLLGPFRWPAMSSLA